MNQHLRACAIVAIASFALMIAIGVLGNVAAARHWIRPPEGPTKGYAPYVLAVLLVLVVALAFSLVPLMVRGVLRAQEAASNGALGLVRFLRDHENAITYAMWALLGLGSMIAIPAMLIDNGLFRLPVAAAQGALVADVGMKVADVRAQSSLKLVDGIEGGGDGRRLLIGQQPFDFEPPGGPAFPQSRYYWIETAKDGETIHKFQVGISPEALALPDHQAAMAATRERLRAAGWIIGGLRHVTERQLTLAGGKEWTNAGVYWARGGTALRLLGQRTDEEQPGEDRSTAGRWIQVLEIGARDSSSFEGVTFGAEVPEPGLDAAASRP